MGREVKWNFLRLYGFEFALILDEKVWKRTLAKMELNPSDYPESAAGTTFFRANKSGYRPRAIVTMNLEKGLVGIQVAAMLAHEAQHIVQFIEDEIGERKFSHEAECYLLQNIVQDLMEDYVEMGGHPNELRD